MGGRDEKGQREDQLLDVAARLSKKSPALVRGLPAAWSAVSSRAGTSAPEIRVEKPAVMQVDQQPWTVSAGSNSPTRDGIGASGAIGPVLRDVVVLFVTQHGLVQESCMFV